MHYHVIREDYNSRSGQPLEPVDIGIALDYFGAKVAATQDEKQFKVPGADRGIIHLWTPKKCVVDGHLPGPTQKGRIR
jgi:hypothetical protein